MLHFVKTCEFFCLTSVFVLVIRYSVMYNVSLLFFSVNIKILFQGLAFLSCFIRYRLIYFIGGGKLEILIAVPLFQDEQFF